MHLDAAAALNKNMRRNLLLSRFLFHLLTSTSPSSWSGSKVVSILVTSACLIACSASPTRSDAIITGRPCVVDGNTIQIGGRVKDAKCWGGVPVKLHGSTSPELDEVCANSVNENWSCGLGARAALFNIAEGKKTICHQLTGQFDGSVPYATCISGRIDLAREMVLDGMAKRPEGSERYKEEEEKAKEAKRGLWQ